MKMTTFGEIAEPTSRSIWEDWDDSDISNYSRVQWREDLIVTDSIENLLIVEGNYLADCITTQTDSKMVLVNSVPDLHIFLYKIAEVNEFICVIKEYDLVQSSDIVELLKDLIVKSNNVFTILTKPLVEFQSQEVLTQGSIMRSLSTRKPITGLCANMNIPKLEQPNIISGVSAGVVWLREIFGLSALAIIFYLELAEDQENQQLQMLLENLNIGSFTIKPPQILSTNLYI